MNPLGFIFENVAVRNTKPVDILFCYHSVLIEESLGINDILGPRARLDRTDLKKGRLAPIAKYRYNAEFLPQRSVYATPVLWVRV